jgi:hypothetical protein
MAGMSFFFPYELFVKSPPLDRFPGPRPQKLGSVEGFGVCMDYNEWISENETMSRCQLKMMMWNGMEWILQGMNDCFGSVSAWKYTATVDGYGFGWFTWLCWERSEPSTWIWSACFRARVMGGSIIHYEKDQCLLYVKWLKKRLVRVQVIMSSWQI